LSNNFIVFLYGISKEWYKPLILSGDKFKKTTLGYHSKHRLSAGVIMELIKIIISIILPPLGVFMQVGIGKHFWLNILLTLCGYIPGIVHAIWVIAKNK
jgi:uncharacterized membrane protein YqaE (UPF0057 family)